MQEDGLTNNSTKMTGPSEKSKGSAWACLVKACTKRKMIIEKLEVDERSNASSQKKSKAMLQR